jgi:hypothetical protein
MGARASLYFLHAPLPVGGIATRTGALNGGVPADGALSFSRPANCLPNPNPYD